MNAPGSRQPHPEWLVKAVLATPARLRRRRQDENAGRPGDGVENPTASTVPTRLRAGRGPRLNGAGEPADSDIDRGAAARRDNPIRLRRLIKEAHGSRRRLRGDVDPGAINAIEEFVRLIPATFRHGKVFAARPPAWKAALPHYAEFELQDLACSRSRRLARVLVRRIRRDGLPLSVHFAELDSSRRCGRPGRRRGDELRHLVQRRLLRRCDPKPFALFTSSVAVALAADEKFVQAVQPSCFFASFGSRARAP